VVVLTVVVIVVLVLVLVGPTGPGVPGSPVVPGVPAVPAAPSEPCNALPQPVRDRVTSNRATSHQRLFIANKLFMIMTSFDFYLLF
jgi:hypothetical protein